MVEEIVACSLFVTNVIRDLPNRSLTDLLVQLYNLKGGCFVHEMTTSRNADT